MDYIIANHLDDHILMLRYPTVSKTYLISEKISSTVHNNMCDDDCCLLKHPTAEYDII